MEMNKRKCNCCGQVIDYGFGVGDLITYTPDSKEYNAVLSGAKAVIVKIDDEYIYVKWINKMNSSIRNGQMDGGYDAKDFELLEKYTGDD